MTTGTASCPTCGIPLGGTRKFCGGCGASLSPEGTAHVRTVAGERFARHVETVARGGTAISQLVDSLLQDADALGVTKAEAMDVIERQALVQTSVPVRCWYDRDHAEAGVAGGSTLLTIRIQNTASRSIEATEVMVVHPEDESIALFPDVGLLTKDASRDTEATLCLTQVGRQAIRDGFVVVRLLGAPPVFFRFDRAIRVNAESATVGRTSIHSVSQTIQTHGGGVISADGLHAHARATDDRWVEIPLAPVEPAALELARSRAEARRATADRHVNDVIPSRTSSLAPSMSIDAPSSSPTPPPPAPAPPVVHIVNNVGPAVAPPVVPSDRAVQTRSLSAVAITVVIVVGLAFIALLAGLVLM